MGSPRKELPPDWFCEGQTAIEDFLDPPIGCRHPHLYFCPTSGDDECPDCGGFDTCCEEPNLHRNVNCPHCQIPVQDGDGTTFGTCYTCGDATWDSWTYSPSARTTSAGSPPADPATTSTKPERSPSG